MDVLDQVFDNLLDIFAHQTELVLPSRSSAAEEVSKEKGELERRKDGVWRVPVKTTGYKPDELTVKIMDRQLIIEGRHEEKDNESSLSREFRRSFTIPSEVDMETVVASVNCNGHLCVKAAYSKVPEDKHLEMKETQQKAEENHPVAERNSTWLEMNQPNQQTNPERTQSELELKETEQNAEGSSSSFQMNQPNQLKNQELKQNEEQLNETKPRAVGGANTGKISVEMRKHNEQEHPELKQNELKESEHKAKDISVEIVHSKKMTKDHETTGDQVVAVEKRNIATVEAAGFKPEEISVRIKDGKVLVQAIHEENDQGVFVYRELRREVPIPADVETSLIEAELNEDGLLNLNAASRKESETKAEKDQGIVIKVTVPAHSGDRKTIEEEKSR